nr:reverse transcriptase domain-containing protein [Tanacetum cinerariifolium]
MICDLTHITPLYENCSAVILKKLPEKLGDPGKFLILNKLGLPELISTRMTLELANRAICTPAGIARDVFIPVGKFTFPAAFVIVDYESDLRVPLILGRPFLRTARALIDVHGEEMILCDGDERLTLNMRHDTSSYSNQPHKESINLINVFNHSNKDFLENLFSNQLSGNPTFLSHPELTLPGVKNDIFDLEGGNVLPEKLLDLDSTKDLHLPLHDIYSSLKDSIDQSNLANPADNFVDSMPEMFTDEHALDYSSPSIFDEYDDDFLEVESDTENDYDDPFDSKGEKIKESKLLIDELDLPCDFLLPFEYDSFISQDFSRVDALPSTNNEDKVFNPGILIQEKPFEIITRVVQDKKLATSNASLVLEDFDHPLYEPFFFKEVSRSNMLLPFSSKNEENIFKLGIHFEMSRDVLIVGSTIGISFLYRGEYSQWVERFMNYLEEQTDREAMINSIKNGDQPLSRVTQVSIAGTTSTEQPPLKDKSMWSDQEKRVQKIDHLARSLLIQGLPNDIYSLIDTNKTAKDLWDALARHMLGSEYGEQDKKAAVLYEYETFKATEGELLLDTYIRYLQVINDLKKCGYSKDNSELNFKFLNNLQPEWKQYATMMRQNKNLMDINIDALYNILKQNQGDVNDAIGSKKKTVVVTSNPLALIAEKTNVSRSKEKVVVSLDSEGSEADDFTVILKKLPEKLGDSGKFLILCGFSDLKCKALADLGVSIKLMPLYVWKKLGLPEFISTRMTLELANRAICTPAGIARDVFVSVGKFTFPADFVIVKYESDPTVPLILGRPFLWTARALIDVHGKEMILRDGDERLTLNMRHDTSSYSNQPQKESINLINVFNNSSEDFLEDLFTTQPSGNPTFPSHHELTSPKVKDDIFDPEGGHVLPEKLLDLDSTKDLHLPLHVNPLSGSTTYSSSPLLEELHIDSSLKDSIDQSNLANLADNFVDSMPEMLTDEHALDYSSPPIFDEYDDDFLEVESDTENVDDDPFDSKGEKIKESKFLIDELDLPCDFLPSEYDSFIS